MEYTGVDIQPNVIADANAAHASDPLARFITADCFKLTERFPDNTFAVATCYRLLHHLPWFEQALSQLAAISRLFIHTALPIAEKSHCLKMREINHDTGNVTYSFYRFFSQDEIECAAQPLNMEVTIIPPPEPPYSTVIFNHKTS